MPVPVRVTTCGLPGAASEIVTAALRLPTATGSKLTVIVQLPPAATEVPHVFVSGKSPGFVPVTATPVTLKAAFPLFVRVTDCAAVLVPTDWLPKLRVLAERPTPAEAPVPDKLTV